MLDNNSTAARRVPPLVHLFFINLFCYFVIIFIFLFFLWKTDIAVPHGGITVHSNFRLPFWSTFIKAQHWTLSSPFKVWKIRRTTKSVVTTNVTYMSSIIIIQIIIHFIKAWDRNRWPIARQWNETFIYSLFIIFIYAYRLL